MSTKPPRVCKLCQVVHLVSTRSGWRAQPGRDASPEPRKGRSRMNFQFKRVQRARTTSRATKTMISSGSPPSIRVERGEGVASGWRAEVRAEPKRDPSQAHHVRCNARALASSGARGVLLLPFGHHPRHSVAKSFVRMPFSPLTYHTQPLYLRRPAVGSRNGSHLLTRDGAHVPPRTGASSVL